MHKPTTIGGWCFAIYVVLRGLMDILGAIDFLVERTSDPGWLSALVRYSLDPPGWMPLLLGLIAIGLILWPQTAKNGPQRSVTRELKLIVPLTLTIISGFGLLIGVAWLVAVYKGSPQTNAKAQTQEQWSPAKAEALDRTFRILQDEMLPAYDALGDNIASPWRRRILEVGPKEYVKEIHTDLKGTSAAVRNLSELLENQAIYPDLVNEFKGAPEQQNKMVAVANAFQAEINHLPDKPEDRTLNLVEAEASAFKGAVGVFGQWVRGRIQRAVELKEVASPQPAGTWKGNKFIYNEPRLIQTFTVGPEDDGQFFRFHVSGVDSGAFVMFKVEYDEGHGKGMIVVHENQEVNWDQVSRKTQSGIQLRSDNTTVLKVRVPGPSDMTIIRVYALWWRPRPNG